jgi:hypothetical protein
MQRHQLGQIIEDEFLLVAIHSDAEDYKLAFLINKHLNFHLKRKETDLDFYKKEGHITFSVFEHLNKEKEDIFYLISNICKSVAEKTTSAGSLFETSSQENTFYLIPEFKTAEYFLKVVSDEPKLYEQIIVNELNKIPKIITSYQIDLNKLKSKNNLNFD